MAPPYRLEKFDDAGLLADRLSQLAQRLSELEARDRVLLSQIISLEKSSGSKDFAAARARNEQVEALLAGQPFIASHGTVSELDLLREEKEHTVTALRKGWSRHYQLAAERSKVIDKSYFGEIVEVEKRRIMLVLELQRTNRAREALREKIKNAGGSGDFSTDSFELLGIGDSSHDGTQEAVERAINDGICSSAEIKKASA